MQTFSVSPKAIISSLVRNRLLIHQMIRRNVAGRFRGSALGLFWSFVHPILLLLVYTFVFGVIFPSSWDESRGIDEFAAILFSGLVVYRFFSECLNRATSLITGNTNYVTKVVFPLEILPWVTMGVATFQLLINIVVLLIFFLFVHGSLAWTALFLPLVLLPLMLLTLGISWMFASFGVFFRDIGEIVGLATMALLFLSPIFYPVSSVPEAYRDLFYLNPLAFIIEESRGVLLWDQLPDFVGLGIYTAVSLLIAWAGFAWFQKTRKGFADVL